MTKLDLFAPFRDSYAADEQAHQGPQYWRSLEHKARAATSRELTDQEFPHGSAIPPVWSVEEAAADPSFGMQRRDLLKLMGASMALAGVGSACVRRPEEEILPYTRAPEDVIPGVASYYATAMPTPDGSVGVLVESHEGRPTKVEGNPDHPASLGRADIAMQGSVLQLYDPDRSTAPRQFKPSEAPMSWADWDQKIWPEMERALLANGGAGLALLTSPALGPTAKRLLADIQVRFPQSRRYAYDAMTADNTRLGAEMVFGAGARVHHDLSKAKVILALDSDFLVEGPDHIALAAGYAKGRDFNAVPSSRDVGAMNRLYSVEAVFSVTGTNADHRLRVGSSEVAACARQIARDLVSKQGVTAPAEFGETSALLGGTGATFAAGNPKFIPALVKDLAANRGRAVVLVGERQPAAVHALAHVLNASLGAFESGLVSLSTEPNAQPHVSGIESLAKVKADLESGAVQTLMILGSNPLYTAPGALGLSSAFARAKTIVHVGLYADETAEFAHVHLPQSHYLECWDDAESWSGVATVCQPLVEPLHQTRSLVEVLAQVATGKVQPGRDIVNATWSQRPGYSQGQWRQWLHDGVIAAGDRVTTAGFTTGTTASAATRVSEALSKLATVTLGDNNLELVFTTNAAIGDGRYANLAWNQELPDPVTKLCWDNALIVGPALARSLGVTSQIEQNAYRADIVTVQVGSQSADMPVFVLPGVGAHSAYVHVGYGRRRGGFVANGVGVDATALKPVDGQGFVAQVQIKKTGRSAILAGTQDHFSVEGLPIQESTTLSLGGRPIYREGGAAEYSQNPLFAKEGDITTLAVHAPGDLSALVEARSYDGNKPRQPARPTEGIQLYGVDVHSQPWTYDGQSWGMTIDLTSCIGCNACAIACQAENNIPVVGREQVLNGREMHWIRIDRYFTGDVDEPKAAHQAVPCMQCENAPCEPVCPVAATVHDEEGLNSMVYNRCIGTRYCANNCPFKVRRFNFHDFTHSAHLYVAPPHDERRKLLKMVRNPDVTVRFRGVMEKCTYCTQRIQEAKFAAKRKGQDHRNLPDGAVNPACAQTCPTNAISFGNVNGKNADGTPYAVAQRKMSDRNYEMLSELNVRPRTTYLAKLRNSNPELV